VTRLAPLARSRGPSRWTWLRHLRALHADLRTSEAWWNAAWDREQKALLGAAMVFSDELPRRAIRRIAHHAVVRLLMHYREVYAGLEGVRLLDFERLEAVARSGAIVAPFHIGPFRLTAPALLSRGYRVALLGTEAALPLHTQEIPAHFAANLAEPIDAAEVRARYEPIDSTSPTALWKACTALRDGRLVIVYPDGNTGIDQRTPDASCHPLVFLGQRVAVRTGVAALALATGRPIVPVIGREGLGVEPTLRFEEPIVRAPDEAREAFRARVMDTLFGILEREVVRAPDRWEQWPFVWQWTDRTPHPIAEDAEPARVDLRALGPTPLRLVNPFLWPIELGGTQHVVDLRTWHSLGSSQALAALVEAAAAGVTVDTWLRALPASATAATAAAVADLLARAIRLGAVAVGGEPAASTHV
jgi:lauroyl/myristoyl acyltransferase